MTPIRSCALRGYGVVGVVGVVGGVGGVGNVGLILEPMGSKH